MILISGATGFLGAEVVAHLLASGAKGGFCLLARDAEKARPYSNLGIEVRIADFDSPQTLAAAFSGIEKFLFISTMSTDRAAQQMRVVDVAVAAGIEYIAYTGLAIHDIDTSGVRELMASHFQTEDHIRASGVAYSFLRNSMYAEAIPQIVGRDALEKGIFLPGGTGRVPYALRADMGQAAANLIMQGGHDGKTYNIVGNDAWGYDDIARNLSKLTGRALSYHDIPEEALREGLKAAGVPDFPIWLTLGTLQDIKSGQYDIASHDLEALLGRPPASLDQMLATVFGLEHDEQH